MHELRSRIGRGLLWLAVGMVPGGCGLLGGTGLLGERGHGAATGDAAGLLEPGTRQVELTAGANFYRCTIRYEGSERESWAFDDAFHCPPELSEHPHADDDPRPPDAAAELTARVPGWCDAYTGWGKGSAWLAGGVYRPQRLPEPSRPDVLLDASTAELLEVARFIGVAACDRMHYRPRQQWVAYWMAHWRQVTGLDDVAMQVLMSELVAHESALPLAAEIGCKRGALVSALTCPEPPPPPDASALDLQELTAEIDPRDRLVYLMSCRTASCRVDANAVDWREVPQIIRKDTDLAILRFAADHELDRFAKELRRRASSPDAAADAAIAAAAEFRAAVADPSPALRSAFAVIAASVREQPVGPCPDGLEAAVLAQLGPDRSTKGLQQRLEAPVPQLLFRALTLCDDGDRWRQQARAQVLRERSSQWLGPRRAARVAAHESVHLLRLPEGASANARGIVAAVEAGPEGQALVRLQPQLSTEDIDRCHDTNRVEAIRSDGTLVYGSRCRVVGHTKVRVTPTPLLVSAAEGKALTEGMFLEILTPRPYAYEERRDGKIVQPAGAPRPATIVAAYRDADDAARDQGVVVWLGAPL